MTDEDSTPSGTTEKVLSLRFTVILNSVIAGILLVGALACAGLGIASLMSDQPQEPLSGNGYMGVGGMPYSWACFLPLIPFVYIGVSFAKDRKDPYTQKAAIGAVAVLLGAIVASGGYFWFLLANYT